MQQFGEVINPMHSLISLDTIQRDTDTNLRNEVEKRTT